MARYDMDKNTEWVDNEAPLIVLEGKMRYLCILNNILHALDNIATAKYKSVKEVEKQYYSKYIGMLQRDGVLNMNAPVDFNNIIPSYVPKCTYFAEPEFYVGNEPSGERLQYLLSLWDTYITIPF